MNEIPKVPTSGAARKPFNLQFITTPTVDTPGTSIILQFDDRRYIFGRVSEGLQRACTQRGVSLKKIRNIFLTGQTKWADNGGLIGMVLSMAEVQQLEREYEGSNRRPRLNIHGGPKLLHTIACARRFVFRTSMPLTVHENPNISDEWSSEPDFVDENIRVWTLYTKSSNTVSAQTDNEEQQPSLNGSYDQQTIEMEQQLRRNIVHDMFDSEWRRDRLVETPFNEVKMPATVWIRDPEDKQLQGYNCTTMHDAPEIGPDQVVLVRNPWPASLIGELPRASNLKSEVTTSYIVKGHPQRAPLDVKKAIALGVKLGPDLGRLTNGESVVTADQNVVTPEMVLRPAQPGKGFAIFDLPGPEFFEPLQKQLARRPEQSLDGIETIIWLCENEIPTILIDSLKGFKHIVASAQTSQNYLAFDSCALSAMRLSRIAPDHFPVPEHSNSQLHQPIVMNDNVSQIESTDIISAQRGLKIRIEPNFNVELEEIPRPVALSDINDMNKNAQDSSIHYNLIEPEIITLGTGSAIPSKYRNVSATLLRMPDGLGNYLFDCGENTLGQLKRVFLASELDDVLTNLRAIWISHLHADHHLGTISVLRACKEASERNNNIGHGRKHPVSVFSEVNMLDFLGEYASVEIFLQDPKYLCPVVCTSREPPRLHGEEFDPQKYGIPFKSIETARVSHCHGAQAISITFTNGFKFSYSGDCRPSEYFTEIGADSDVLLHEATFEDGMEGDAMAKKHSTTAEALGVGLKMRAKNVVLTHFSQRYQKIPVLSNIKLPEQMRFEEGVEMDNAAAGPVDDGMNTNPAVDGLEKNPTGPNPASTASNSDSLMNNGPHRPVNGTPEELLNAAANMNVCVAFDYMRVKVSEIKAMKKYYPAIEAMFQDQAEKSEKAKEEIRRQLDEQIARKKEKVQAQRQKNADKQARKKPNANATGKEINGEKSQPALNPGNIAETSQTRTNDEVASAWTNQEAKQFYNISEDSKERNSKRSSASFDDGDIQTKMRKL